MPSMLPTLEDEFANWFTINLLITNPPLACMCVPIATATYKRSRSIETYNIELYFKHSEFIISRENMDLDPLEVLAPFEGKLQGEADLVQVEARQIHRFVFRYTS